MELLDLLDGEAGSGRQIDVKWHCDPDDDITREFAQDISSDATHIAVELCDLAPLEVTSKSDELLQKITQQLQSDDADKDNLTADLEALINLYHKQDRSTV